MMISYKLITLCLFLIPQSEPARILGVFPFPAISHQVVFRSLMVELARRGHEVTVITPNPGFSKGQAPTNYTEIDVHDISYTLWYKLFEEYGNFNNRIKMMEVVPEVMIKVFEVQLKSTEVQKLINDKNRKFDLLYTESLVRPALVFSHLYKVPVISFSSLSGIWGIFDVTGASTHHLIYPEPQHYRIYNLTLWDKIKELYLQYQCDRIYANHLPMENKSLKKLFGPDTPDLEELERNIQMLFLNSYPMWDFNRPVPPNVVYLGGLHLNPQKELPQDIKSYLDSSKNGVIYFSLGTNIMISMFPPEKLKILTNTFAKLPYDILFKFEKDELPGRSENVKIFKWLPQSDLLRHPKVKVFITQAGLQSTDEALTAGVPLVAIPMLGDQWFNAEHYVQFKIGKQLDYDFLTEESLEDAILTVIEDRSYRENVIKLRNKLRDQPQSSMDRAVWWTEHALRHGGATHLRARAAFMHWTEYYELKLVIPLVAFISTCSMLIVYVTYYVVLKLGRTDEKVKNN